MKSDYMAPSWDWTTRVLALLGRSVFLLTGLGMVAGTFPCYTGYDASLQMLKNEDGVTTELWEAIGKVKEENLDGKQLQDFIIYYGRTEFAAEMVLGMVWLYFGLMPRSLLPYHVRFACWCLYFVMCAVGYGESALVGGNPYLPNGGADVTTNEFTSMFLPLGVIGCGCFMGEWARVSTLEKAAAAEGDRASLLGR